MKLTGEQADKFYAYYYLGSGVDLIYSSHHLGLVYDNQLAAAMSFNQLGEEWELARFATSHHVIGGASKLLKRFITDNEVTKLVSYSDNRLFTGGMYKVLGFTEDGQVPPSYSYWRDGSRERLHKSKFRHSELPKILGDRYNPNLTERENCENNGYYQIYDDGLTRWTLNLENFT